MGGGCKPFASLLVGGGVPLPVMINTVAAAVDAEPIREVVPSGSGSGPSGCPSLVGAGGSVWKTPILGLRAFAAA